MNSLSEQTQACMHLNLVRPDPRMYSYSVCGCVDCHTIFRGHQDHYFEDAVIRDKAYLKILGSNPENRPNKMNIAPPESFPRGDPFEK